MGSTVVLVITDNTYYQHTLSIVPLICWQVVSMGSTVVLVITDNTYYQPISAAHLINTSYQHLLSITLTLTITLSRLLHQKGPSEVLVIADNTCDPNTVAADLLAQAEHDTEAR